MFYFGELMELKGVKRRSFLERSEKKDNSLFYSIRSFSEAKHTSLTPFNSLNSINSL